MSDHLSPTEFTVKIRTGNVCLGDDGFPASPNPLRNRLRFPSDENTQVVKHNNMEVEESASNDHPSLQRLLCLSAQAETPILRTPVLVMAQSPLKPTLGDHLGGPLGRIPWGDPLGGFAGGIPWEDPWGGSPVGSPWGDPLGGSQGGWVPWGHALGGETEQAHM